MVFIIFFLASFFKSYFLIDANPLLCYLPLNSAMPPLHDTMSTIARLFESNLLYFPELNYGKLTFSSTSNDKSKKYDDTYFILPSVARFRVITAGLCTNWYSSPSQWYNIARSVDCKSYNNRLNGLLKELGNNDVAIPLVLHTWAWNRSYFGNQRRKEQSIDPCLHLDLL